MVHSRKLNERMLKNFLLVFLGAHFVINLGKAKFYNAIGKGVT